MANWPLPFLQLSIDLWKTSTLNQFHIWKHAYILKGDVPPQTGPIQLIDPKFTEPYYTERPYPANQHQEYRPLLHQTNITYWEMRPYPEQMDPPILPPIRPYPAHQPEVYRPLLHQTNISYCAMWPYPVQMEPPTSRPYSANQLHVYRALLSQTSITLLRNKEALPH